MYLEARNFNKKSYNENNQLAKSLLINWLKNYKHQIINESENYNHDIISKCNDKTFYFEVEMKIGYPFTNKESFKFNTVSFLGRKERLHQIHPFTYVIICKETNWALAANSNDIFKKEYIQNVHVNSKDRYGDDIMYRVPKQYCKFFNLIGNK
jgi:hypothetical protein